MEAWRAVDQREVRRSGAERETREAMGAGRAEGGDEWTVARKVMWRISTLRWSSSSGSSFAVESAVNQASESMGRGEEVAWTRAVAVAA